jgi:hypothetical protein
MWGRRVALAGLLLAWFADVGAQPISVAQLQGLLQRAPQRELRFHETRESPWLAAPIESSGRMTSSSTMLEKAIEQPRRETWRILPDRVERLAPGSAASKPLMFNEAPAVAALANALRLVLAGDLAALGKDFQLAPGGDAQLWTLQLTPRRQDVARFLKQLELQGAGTELRVIVTLETDGARTITRLSP